MSEEEKKDPEVTPEVKAAEPESEKHHEAEHNPLADTVAELKSTVAELAAKVDALAPVPAEADPDTTPIKPPWHRRRLGGRS